ncbi:MAG: hypothetical protein CMG71_07400 [Candidatus Marinimicrobia bacterium]|nr:hypothetical protein [Candidatus Neomarinimicrobiota bacterium]|tara:strand:- start:9764 stop:9952 length:189 start_codon:yes stop_codon:yes gene_type:complete
MKKSLAILLLLFSFASAQEATYYGILPFETSLFSTAEMFDLSESVRQEVEATGAVESDALNL